MTALTLAPDAWRAGSEPEPLNWQALADRLQAVGDPTRLRLLPRCATGRSNRPTSDQDPADGEC